MNLQELKSMFPMELQVTQEIIDKSNPYLPYDCVGHHALRSIIGDNAVVMWTDTDGEIRTPEGRLFLKTKGKVSMMDIEKPRTVTFELI